VRLVSVSVGLPREVAWKGKTVTTSIFKAPVDGPVALRRHNLEGDRQADLSVHGGPTKAVYLYPTAHYAYWRDELGDTELAWGSFGENFTVDGLDEESVCIGDEFRVGSARVIVTEPRTPCFKLAIRMGIPGFPATFLRSCRVGFYLRVLEEGEVGAGDTMERVHVDPAGLTVRNTCRLRFLDLDDRAAARRAMAVTALPPGWRRAFEKLANRT